MEFRENRVDRLNDWEMDVMLGQHVSLMDSVRDEPRKSFLNRKRRSQKFFLA